MNHFIYTVDIATPRALTVKEQHDLIMAFDSTLESFPLEFEDWSITTKTEERGI